MKVFITGVCGFVGSKLAESLIERVEGIKIIGMDNLMRPGSETNRERIGKFGVKFIHGDLRSSSDLAGVPTCDWVIDAAANPSVLAGLSGEGSSRRLFEHNLSATGNILEYCRERQAGLLLLSSSRVYSIPALVNIPLRTQNQAFSIDPVAPLPQGLTMNGIGPDFSTGAPISLYGATKLSSEIMALEYGAAFNFPVWITRCGVLAGVGQFGTPSQGIFAFWINAHLRRRPIRLIGFQGTGYQTRDAFHPRDLASLLLAQMRTGRMDGQRIYTAGGGPSNAMSLRQLTSWCDERFGSHNPEIETETRIYDIPWIAMDNALAGSHFNWQVETGLARILEEIAEHALANPNWLDISGA